MSSSDQISKKKTAGQTGFKTDTQQRLKQEQKAQGLFKEPRQQEISAHAGTVKKTEKPLGEDKNIEALPVDEDEQMAYDLLNKSEQKEFNKYIKAREESQAAAVSE